MILPARGLSQERFEQTFKPMKTVKIKEIIIYFCLFIFCFVR
jgi:hypothetical protein